MKKIGIITYACPHLKTEQILMNLLKEYLPNDIKVYALPFKVRPKRRVFFEHRPDQFNAVSAKEICNAYGISYYDCRDDLDIENDCQIYLITGAGILSAEMLEKKTVINAHPGIIPAARGLDSFKWSIYNNIPIGITLHYIDKNVDMGQVISVVQTPVFASDTLETLARRHYENEISVLASFSKYLKNPRNEFSHIEMREATRRMQFETEQEMMQKFEAYKKRFGSGAEYEYSK